MQEMRDGNQLGRRGLSELRPQATEADIYSRVGRVGAPPPRHDTALSPNPMSATIRKPPRRRRKEKLTPIARTQSRGGVWGTFQFTAARCAHDSRTISSTG